MLIIAMTIAEGVVFVLLGQVSDVWWAAALLIPLGVGVAYSSDVALPTFIQTTTPPHLLASISSLIALPRVIFEPLSIALIGLVLQQSVPWGFAIAALPVLVAGTILATDRRARQLSTNNAETPAADRVACLTGTTTAGEPISRRSREDTRHERPSHDHHPAQPAHRGDRSSPCGRRSGRRGGRGSDR